MGHLARVPAHIAIGLALTGCATLEQGIPLSAHALKPIQCACATDTCPMKPESGDTRGTSLPSIDSACTTNKTKAYDLVQDSLTKCSAFITHLFARISTANSSLDITGGALSAIAGITTPISASHILAAGSTIASAAKTSIDSQYLGTLAISHIIQSIESTYYPHMADYVARLSGKSATDVDLYDERAQILSVHALCSMPVAEASISSTLQSPTSPSGSAPAVLTFSILLHANLSASATAQVIASAIEGDPSAQSAGVTAAFPDEPSSSIKISSTTTFSWSAVYANGDQQKQTATFAPTSATKTATLTITNNASVDDKLVITGKPATTEATQAELPTAATRLHISGSKQRMEAISVGGQAIR